MSFSDFQKDAKNKLDDYRPEIDADALWAELEPQVEAQKKRRLFLWLFLSWIIGVGVLFGGYRFAKSYNDQLPNAIEIEAKPIATEIEKDQGQTVLQAHPTPTTNEINPIPTTNDLSPPTNLKQVQVGIDADPAAKNIKLFSETTRTNTSAKFASDEKKASIPLGKATPEATAESLTRLQSPLLPDRKEPIAKTRATTLAKIEGSLSAFEKVPSKTIQAQAEDTTEEWMTANADRGATNALEYQKKKSWKMALGLQADWGRLNQDLQYLTSNDPAYLGKRVATEKELEELNFGLGVELLQKRGLYFQTGLEYTRLATKATWTSSITTVEQKENRILKIYTDAAKGDTTFVYGTVEESTTIESNRLRYNNFHLLQIPLTAGFRWQREAWSFGFEGGVQVNAYMQVKGAIEGLTGDLYDLKKDEADWLKDQLGLRATAALHLGYAFNPNWRFVVSPRYHFPLKMTTAISPLEQQFSSLGISAGIWYQL